jgi:hypothetical protein
LSLLRSQLAAAEIALAEANEAGASVCGCGWIGWQAMIGTTQSEMFDYTTHQE